MVPPNADNVVNPPLPVRVSDIGTGKTNYTTSSVHVKPSGSRRIFVQTDTGSVIGLDLDQTDNVQTVKKKMQSMLNVPTEQTTLVFGETVLKSDLSCLRHESPLLLTRELHRSLSTPIILPPTDSNASSKRERPLEVVGGFKRCARMKKMIKAVMRALESGSDPVSVGGGLGGAYYVKNSRGDNLAVVKPTDEEPFAPNNPKGFVGKALGQPGLKRAVRVGETGIREVAAYLLDHDSFAKVPPTVLVKVSHRVFHVNVDTIVHKQPHRVCSRVAKLASCQQFVPHDFDASDHGTSCFSVSAVHRIGILDLRIFNTDRHGGNILIRKPKPREVQGSWSSSSLHVNDSPQLIPIDHGLCLPEELEDPYFEWLHWPQASVPFSEEELQYIANLDVMKDVDLLRSELPMLREACHRILILSTTVLKKAAAAGLCLAEIGEMMSRDGMEEASQLEQLCLQAKTKMLMNRTEDKGMLSESSLEEESDEQFEFDLDEQVSSPVPVLNLQGQFPWSSTLQRNSSLEKTADKGCPSLKTVPEAPSLEEEDTAGNTTTEWTCLLNKRVAALPPKNVEPFEKIKASVASPTKQLYMQKHILSPNCADRNGSVASPSSTLISIHEDIDSPPRLTPDRTVSLNFDNQFNVKMPRTPAPQLSAKPSISPTGSVSQFSLGEMTSEEWTSFLSSFVELLEEAVTKKCNHTPNYRNRLGTSCQF